MQNLITAGTNPSAQLSCSEEEEEERQKANNPTNNGHSVPAAMPKESTLFAQTNLNCKMILYHIIL